MCVVRRLLQTELQRMVPMQALRADVGIARFRHSHAAMEHTAAGTCWHLSDAKGLQILRGVSASILLRQSLRIESRRLRCFQALVHATFVVAGATNAALLVRPDLLLASKNGRLVLMVAHLSKPLQLGVSPVIP